MWKEVVHVCTVHDRVLHTTVLSTLQELTVISAGMRCRVSVLNCTSIGFSVHFSSNGRFINRHTPLYTGSGGGWGGSEGGKPGGVRPGLPSGVSVRGVARLVSLLRSLLRVRTMRKTGPSSMWRIVSDANCEERPSRSSPFTL